MEPGRISLVVVLLLMPLCCSGEAGADGPYKLTTSADKYVTLGERHLPPRPTGDDDASQDEYRILQPQDDELSGHFSLKNSPNQVAVEFTQEQVRRGELVFVPPPAHLVLEERTATFLLSRTGPESGDEQRLRFAVRLLPIEHPDSPGPRFRVPSPTITIPAKAGVAVNISRKYFEVEGFSDVHVQFMVTEEPTQGALVLLRPDGTGAPLTGVDEFTNADIRSGVVVQYRQQQLGAALDDSFELMATDSQGEAFNRVHLRHAASPQDPASRKQQPEVVSLQVGEGQRVVLTSDYFSYALSGGGGRRDVNYTLLDAPVYGDLVLRVGQGLERVLAQGGTFRQDDANQGRLEYRAVSEIGLRAVTDRVPLRIDDSTGSRYRPQLLAISIAPEDNQAPMVTVNGEIVVREGGIEALPPTLITVSDPDTPTEQLLFVLDTPPTFGFLQANYSGLQVSPAGQFPAGALELGAVRYVQSFHADSEPTRDALFFHVTDGANRSPSMRLNVSIEPVNDEIPLILTEVMDVDSSLGTLIKNSTLFVSDFDTPPSNLIITLLQEPRHGIIQRRTSPKRPLRNGDKVNAGDSFSYLDVVEELLVYEPTPEGAINESQDSAVFSVSDGDFSNQAELVFNFTMDKNSESKATHILEYVIEEGGWKALGKEGLWEAGETELHFVLVENEQPGLQMELKRDGQWTKMKLSDHFTQQDVTKSLIRLKHNEGFATKFFTMKIRVESAEGFVRSHILFVKVRENLAAPWVEVNTGLEVPFSSSVRVTASQLSALDLDSEAGDLRFKIMDEPLSGWFELNGAGRSQQWTQNDLQLGKVQFHHNGKDDVRIENFVFEVTDGNNIVPATMSIQIKEDQRRAMGVPKLSPVRPLRVNPTGRTKLTQFELQVVDDSAAFSDLVFDVIEQAEFGKVEVQRPDGFAQTTQFSMLDVLEGNVYFLHELGKPESPAQSFLKLTLSKKGQRIEYLQEADQITVASPITLPIEVLESGGPTLLVNMGLDFLERVEDRVAGYLSIKHLDAVSEGSPAKKITYTVTTPPSHGLLFTSATIPDSPVSVFTQDDVNAGRIYYQLDDSTDVTLTKDEFIFDISDARSKKLTGNIFRVQWAWINLDQVLYNISEISDEIRIKITKEGGYIKESTTVECAIADNSINGAYKDSFELQHSMVQFDNFDEEEYCVVKIKDNKVYQGKKEFTLEIYNPSKAILGTRTKTQVFVYDAEDQPQITFRSRQIAIGEDQGPMKVEVFRSGDLSVVSSVVCSTSHGSAKGSGESNVSPDYMHRERSTESTVVFNRGASSTYCEIDIIDDAIYETSEDFYVILSDPGPNTALGPITKVKVIITGPNDVSLMYFSQEEFYFNENAGTVELAVTRSGSDLNYRSSVWCTTQPVDARPNEDYVPMSQQVMFERGETEGWCRLSLIDDSVQPTMEGPERLHVILSSPDGSRLSEPSKATVVIDDTRSDIPTFEFEEASVRVLENTTEAQVVILRLGDTRAPASVKCFTRSRAARPNEDYIERPRAEESRVHFRPGQLSSNCSVRVLDDSVFEGEEDLVLGLADPVYMDGEQSRLALVGDRAMMRIYIIDTEDTPRIKFEQEVYVIEEDEETTKSIWIKVVREGDTSTAASVLLTTRDGSAKSGSDYYPVSKTLTFPPRIEHLEAQVTVLPSATEDGREERFYLTLQGKGSEKEEVVVVIRSRAHEAIVLPSQPVVVSLLHYDQAAKVDGSGPEDGYPLVCISPCEPRHPLYEKTRVLCENKNMSIIYFWEVATPNEWHPLRYNPFKRLSKATIFTDAEAKVLDPIYFAPNFNVRCVTQPSKPNGRSGVPIKSPHVTISPSKGFCRKGETPKDSFLGSHTFNANLKYVNASARQNPNTVYIKIEIPHTDGMVPLVSTQPLHNVQTLLTDPLYTSHHSCSNLLVDKSFLKLGPGKKDGQGEWPYQLERSLRGDGAVDLYRNLDMKSCLWKFNAWFHMSELLDYCHGKIISEYKVAEGGKNQMSVEVPLYVSYVSASGAEEWTAIEHRTAMEVSFVYSPLMWHKGLQTEPKHTAKVKVTRVSSNENGQLVLEVSTQALFRGSFILANHKHHSSLTPPRHLASLKFKLEALWSENTWDGPRQQWRATSESSLPDYSGRYHLMLVPCTVAHGVQFTQGARHRCASHQAVQFPLEVNFQVPARPAPAKYALQTEFQITNNPKQFMASPTEDNYVNDEAWQFSPGEMVYGKVRWHPAQDLKDAYRLTIDRVLLCATKDGAEPVIDPSGDLFGHGAQVGCLQPSKVLAHRFVLLDRENPEIADSQVQGVSFDAHFAKDLDPYRKIEEYSGVDGFIWKVDPLYQVNSGHEWLLQVLYRIHATPSSGRSRRSEPEGQSGYVIKGITLSDMPSQQSALIDYSILALTAGVIVLVAVGLAARMALRNSYAVTSQPTGV